MRELAMFLRIAQTIRPLLMAPRAAGAWLVRLSAFVRAARVHPVLALLASTAMVAQSVVAMRPAPGGGSHGGGHQGGGLSVVVTPNTALITAGTTQQFTAAVSGGPSKNLAWSSPDGGSVTSAGLYTAPAMSGQFRVIGTLTKPNGVSASSTAMVTVVPVPVAAVTAPVYMTVGLQGAAQVPAQSGMTYQWSISGATLVSGQGMSAVAFTASTPGTVTLSCTVTNAAGMAVTGQVTSSAVPTPQIGSFVVNPNSIDKGNTAALTGVFSNGMGAVDQGVGILASGTPVPVAPVATTTYTLTVTNPAGTSTSAQTTLQVFPVPVATLTAPATVTAGQVGYLAKVPDQVGMTYAWSLPGGSITAGQGTPQITFTPGAAGAETLTCVVTNGRGTQAVGQQALAVVPPPVAVIAAPVAVTTLATGAPASVADQAGCTYQWTVSGGTLTSGQNTHAIGFKAGGVGMLTLQCQVTNAAGTSVSGTATVPVVPVPVATLTAAALATEGDSNLQASVPVQSGMTYAWSITDGAIVSGQGTPAIVYAATAPGTLQLTCVVTNAAGAVATGTTTTTVYAAPKILSFRSAAPSLDQGSSTSLTGLFSNGTGVIDSGVGSVTSDTPIVVTPATTTTYTLIVENPAGSAVMAQVTIPVFSVPVATLTSPDQVTEGTTLSASVPTQNGMTYSWTITGGSLLSGQGTPAASIQVGHGVSLTLQCVVTNGRGTSVTGLKTLTVVLAPDATIVLPSVVAAYHPGSIATVPNKPGMTYLWNLQGGSITAGQGSPQITFTPGAPGILTAGCAVTNSLGTQASGTATAQIANTPNAWITADPTVLPYSQGNKAWVTNLSGYTYAWTISGGQLTSSTTGSTVTFTAGVAGNLKLACVVTAPGGASETGQRTVVVANPFAMSVNPISADLLTGASQQFSTYLHNPSNPTVIWSASSGSVTQAGLYTAPSIPGTYAVTATSQADLATHASALVHVAMIDVSGGFTSNANEVIQLYQSGVDVVGTWAGGELKAKLDGLVLTGTIRGSIPFALTFSVDGTSFNGVVTYFSGNATRTGTRGTKPILALTPQSQQLMPGGTQAFVAMVGGSTNKTVSWTTTGGMVDATGHYAAPAQIGTYTITATSMADATVSASATVQVTTNGVLDVSGDYTTNASEDLKLFQNGALITGTWNDGEVKATLQGLVLTGTLRGTNPFALTFTPDGQSFSGQLTLYGNNALRTGARNAGVVMMMTPASAVLPQGGAVQFAAPMGGTLVHGVTWTATGGTISTDGLFVAPVSNGVYTVTAISTANPTQSVSATVLVNQNGKLDVSGAFTLNVTEDFQLYQNGSSVTGTWNGGEVVATLEGLVLTGTVRGTNPFSLTFSPDGSSFTGYITLFGNNALRTGTRKTGVILSVLPSSAAVALGGTLAFSASVGGSLNKGVIWTASSGSIGTDGTFTAPTTPGVYTVTATSAADPTATVLVTVVVNAAGVVDVSGDFLTNVPDHLYLFQNGTQITGTWNGQDVRATLQGLALQGTVRGTNPFSFTFSPSGSAFNGILTWEGANLVRSGTRQTGVVVRLSPSASVLAPGESESFQAGVAGTTDTRYTLSASGGAIAPDGTYTAPASIGAYTVTATSIADVSKSATATIQVSATGVLDVSGTYTTNYGALTLYQNGNEVTGTWADTYYSSPAVLRGFLNGTTLQGTWAPGGFWSRGFTLTFAGDGQSFTGDFLDYYSGGIAWSGTRQAGVSIRIEPGVATLQAGSQKLLAIQVAGALDKTFSLTTTGGSVAADGTYTAPTVAGTYTVTATSHADPTKTAQATLQVTATGYRDVTGTYTTGYGDLTLYQSGTVIQGTWNDTYYSRPALLTGVLNGRLLSGTYTIDDWTRAFSITMRDDGSGFDGSFNDYYNGGVGWSGTLKATTVSIRLLPGLATLPVNGNQLFIAQVAGSPDHTFSLSVSGGQILADGSYRSPATPGTYTVTATSHADSTKTATATLQVTANGAMDVSGTYTTSYGALTLYQDGASITGDWTDTYYSRPARITASLSGNTLSGTYSIDTWVQPFTVVIRPDSSGFDGSFHDYYGGGVGWSATLQKGVTSIQITPGVVVVPVGGVQSFKVMVGGNPDKGYAVSATGGSIAPDGTYAAPATAGSYTITATSHADPTKTATAVLQVTANGTMDVSGTYTTNYGALTLYQDGASITGDWTDTYYTRPARITATLSGRTLAGTYSVDTWVQPFTVVMRADASGFDGSFNDYYGGGVGWNGTLQKGVTSIQMTPLNAVVRTQETQGFDVHVAGTPDKAFSLNASGGTISITGLFTAPSLPGLYALTATSHADATKTATSQIQVTGDGLRDVSGTYATNYGSLTLYQAGPTVTGTWTDTYYSVTATLTGTLSGRILTGTYTVPGWSRTFSMTFRDDGSGFDGTFLDYYSGGVTWTSTFQKNQVTVLVNPANSILTPGWTEGFLTQVAGTPDKRINWTVQESNGGSVNGTGAYTAPVATGTFHVVAASAASPACTATATVQVAVVGLQVLPAWTRLRPGSIAYFQATVQGVPLDGISWSIQEGAVGGTVGADGKYTAPAQPGTYHLVATSVVDPAASAVAEVVVTADSVVQVEIAPYTVQLDKGAAQQFTASVANASSNTNVTWKASAGTVDQTGLYTAPSAYGNYTVTATSVEDPSASDTADVIVSSGTGGDKVFTYDLNGNLTSDGTRSFEWDAENRLVAVVKGTHRSEFGYDGFGHRVEIRELDADGNGGWTPSVDTKYVWEGAQILESRSADGGTTLQRYYAQGFMDSDGTALYYTRDHLGSTRELVDAFGAIRARYDYDPYGHMTKISGDKDSPFLYTGHLWHPASGLYLTLYREYDANLGRWISRDPIQERGGQNIYAYVLNNPISWTDRYGLDVTVTQVVRPLDPPMFIPYAHAEVVVTIDGSSYLLTAGPADGQNRAWLVDDQDRVNNELYRRPDYKLTWHIPDPDKCKDKMNRDKLQKLVDEWNNHHLSKYEATGNNCWAFVEWALQQLGVSPGSGAEFSERRSSALN